jgi:ADP-L-glycero-D-manno-heptose 6-epimerase
MVIITGAAGFIGSNLISKLNSEGFKDLILVDDFSRHDKKSNYIGKTYKNLIDRDVFARWLKENQRFVQYVFHLGARTDTAEFDKEVFNRLNLEYSKTVWNICAEFGIPLLYASSAASYGAGEKGYIDSHSIIPGLRPLNAYGESKNDFDKWVLQQEHSPSFWAGLKFFNVYGPNEYHKGRMASVVFHAYNQIRKTGKMKLFRSHNPEYKDGKQLRDFIYVRDIVDIMYWFLHNRKNSGIYNAGTGNAETFLELVNQTFKAMDIKPDIEFIDTPSDIRDKYQYFTQADMRKIRSIGYTAPFFTLKKGVPDYVKNYLLSGKYN